MNSPRHRAGRQAPPADNIWTNRSLVIAAGVVLVVVAVVAFLWIRASSPDGPLVVVDAGHGGKYSNTGIGGIKENDLNLSIAKRLSKKLRSRGYRVIMTRTSRKALAEQPIPNWRYAGEKDLTWAFGDAKLPDEKSVLARSDLQARVDIANEAGADVFVSIHNNASADPATRGAETFAYRGDGPGKALAKFVLDAVAAKTGGPTRASSGSGLYVCRWTNMPAVLVEGGYFTNEEDAKLLKSGRFQNKLADGIADGIDQWFASSPLRQRTPQLSGPDSASLAATISAVAYAQGSPVVVVLPEPTVELGPSASALATRLGCPLLLSSKSELPPATAAELQRLSPDRIIVVGVTKGSDLEKLSAAITDATGSRASVEVVAENSASGAAAAAAGYITVPDSGEVALADVEDIDALTALAPYVARKRIPLLLSKGGKLGDEGLAFLSANRGRVKAVLAIGCAEKPAEPEGYPVTAISSSDADQLAARLLAHTTPATAKRKLKPLAVDPALVPDAFVAAAEAARRNVPLIQLRDGLLGPYSREILVNRSASISRFVLMHDGGSLPAVSESALYKSIGR